MQILAFCLYFAVVLAIGIYFFVKSKGGGEKEYFLGGRQMGPWVSAMSAQASDMSGWLLMGFPGAILALGMGQVWIGIGLALGTIANWIFVAARLRRFSQVAGDSITLPQYLTNRFASANPALKIACAVVFLVAFTIYVASGFVAGTKVFTSIVPALADRKLLALAIFAALILCYTFLGGYKAVCWTDFFQGLMMLCALLLVPIAMCSTDRFDPGWGEAFKAATPDGKDFVATAFGGNPFSVSWQDIVSGLGWGLGYFGMPHILVRFMGIKDPKSVKKSAWIACVWVVLSLGAAVAIAILGRTFLLSDGAALAGRLLPAGKEELVFVTVVNDLFPAFVAGILLAAIIAASMSTADSQLLVASSAFSSDFYQPVVRKNQATDAEMLWVGRFIVMIVAFVAFYVAASGLENDKSWASSIMSMVGNAWGLFGAAFGPVVILSLFWRRFNYAGALAGIVAGAVTDLAWLLVPVIAVKGADGAQTLVSLSKGLGVYEIVPGFVVGLLAAVLASLQTEKPGAKVEAIFDKAVAKA